MASKRPQSEAGKTEKKKRQKRSEEPAELGSAVEDERVKSAVKEAWSRGSRCCQGDLELDCHPFPHCIIKNFLGSETFVENLQRELLQLNFHEKSNDLYKFKQSDDLKKRTEPHITGLSFSLTFIHSCWQQKHQSGYEMLMLPKGGVFVSAPPGQHCLGISAHGSVKCWGLNWSPQWIFLVPDMNTQMFFCVMMMSWRDDELPSFCILCLHGRAATGNPRPILNRW
ncbi:hypothetical protein INR49_024615 [Caranx melampygus]|nr:hypothetical protein INR49_024615 [Caranx melampygus]